MKIDTRLIACALMGCVFSLSGCDVPTPKLPHVTQETVSHPVIFANGLVKFNWVEQDSLDSFLSTIPASSASNIYLAADDTQKKAVTRARGIRNYLVRKGYAAKKIRLVPSPGMDPLTIVLSVDFAKATPPEPCPDWSKNSEADYEVSNASNFGCAYYNDLIVQLANPADYNGAHVSLDSDAARESVIVGHYLSDAPPAAAASSGSSSGASGGTTSTTTSTP